MSANGLVLASFQTMLTVPAASLTAIRGKSLLGKRLYPGTNVATVETILTDAWLNGGKQGDGEVAVRQLRGMWASTSCVGVTAHGPKLVRLEAQLYSKAT